MGRSLSPWACYLRVFQNLPEAAGSLPLPGLYTLELALTLS